MLEETEDTKEIETESVFDSESERIGKRGAGCIFKQDFGVDEE